MKLFSLLLLALPFLALGNTRNLKDKGAKGGKGGKKGKKDKTYNFFSVLNAAQEPQGCESYASGNAIATFDGYELCIMLSYHDLSGLELFSHIHGPALVGEENGVIFTLSMSPIKNDCFTLDKTQAEYLKDGLLYFNIHSETCPTGEIRGQIFAV